MINLREELNIVEPIFITKKGPDKKAAAERLAATREMFEDWHAAINKTNTREMPSELLALYENAATTLCKILDREGRIVTGE